MRRCITLLFFALCLNFLATPIHAAEELGCCIKTNQNDGLKSYMDATKTECEAVPQQSNNIFTIEFKAGKIAFSNQECRDKPPVTTRKQGDPIYFTPGVSIPESDFISGKPVEVQASTQTIANYIVAIFKYSTGVIGIIAAIALMVGGIIWLMAGGNHERVQSAKNIISSSLVGMCIAFSAFLLLSLVNTNLVSWKIKSVDEIQYIKLEPKGCCLKGVTTNTQTSEELTETDCKAIPDTEFYAALVAQYNTCQSTNGKYFKACLNGSDEATTCGAFNSTSAEKKYCNGLADPPRCSTDYACCTAITKTGLCEADYTPCPSGSGYCEDGTCKACLAKGSVCRSYGQCANSEGKCGFGTQGSSCIAEEGGAQGFCHN